MAKSDEKFFFFELGVRGPQSSYKLIIIRFRSVNVALQRGSGGSVKRKPLNL